MFSERVAAIAPHLTLDFLTEFRLGFLKAPNNQKMVCLTYLQPWIRNFSRFATPGDALYERSGARLRDAVHSLCDITLSHQDVRVLNFVCIGQSDV